MFKSKPYWLKGGGIGVLIIAVLMLLLLPFGTSQGTPAIAFYALPLIPALFLMGILGIKYGFGLLLLFSAVLYFVLGVVVGSIVGFVKSR